MYIISRHIIMFDKVGIKYLVYFISFFVPTSIDNNDKEKKAKQKKRWNKNEIFFNADEEQKKGENSLL